MPKSGVGSGQPGVDEGNAGGLKVFHVAGDDCHSMNQCGGSDEAVAVRARVGHVQGGATQRDGRIDRQNASGEGGQNMLVAIQERSNAPWRGSRRSNCRAPVSISRMQITERYMDSAGVLRAQAITCRSALPVLTFRNSEMTLVSSRNIRRTRPGESSLCPGEAARNRWNRPRAWPASQGCSPACR